MTFLKMTVTHLASTEEVYGFLFGRRAYAPMPAKEQLCRCTLGMLKGRSPGIVHHCAVLLRIDCPHQNRHKLHVQEQGATSREQVRSS